LTKEDDVIDKLLDNIAIGCAMLLWWLFDGEIE